MQSRHSGIPDKETLTDILKSLLSENRSCIRPLTIIRREPVIKGTFPKEIVTCRLDNGEDIRLFCKYTAGHNHNSYGHRGGVAHEVDVYSKLLRPMKFSTPSLQGFYIGEEAGEVWLILEYLDRSVRVTKSKNPDAMVFAARWIGKFHAAIASHLESNKITFLKAYDIEYYNGWLQRTLKFAEHFIRHFQWMEYLFENFDKIAKTLLSAPLTVIHGEYYCKNILFRDGKIYPVDWESTALAAGEIDLASLSEGWPEKIARNYEFEYQRERWPEGPPHDFERTLCAAQIYLYLRWLGEVSGLTTPDSWRFERLHSACQRFGII